MKSVGIITLHRTYNFGAVLQAYALRRVVGQLGYRSELIDFHPLSMKRQHQLFVLPIRPAAWKRNWKMLMRLREHLMLRWRFHTFFRRHMGLGHRWIATRFGQLAKHVPKFDTYLSGSDMIWNPCFLEHGHHECGRAFYLEFVKDGQGRRASYASSFGATTIRDVFRERIGALLNRYDSLSAREEFGCELIRQLTGRTAEHVVDPTLLLSRSQYDEAAVAPKIAKPFLLLYPMEPSDLFCHTAQEVGNVLGLPAIAVVPHNSKPENFAFADKVVYDAGPAEFLGWMRDASFVCTNSYHGLCFSLIYRKQFLSVADTHSNARSFSLLRRLGIADRQANRIETFTRDHPLMRPIDYPSLEPQLRRAINHSLEYLRRALA